MERRHLEKQIKLWNVINMTNNNLLINVFCRKKFKRGDLMLIEPDIHWETFRN